MTGSGLIGRAVGAADGTRAIAQVMATDVARSLGVMNGAPPDDWLDARDPDYIRQALPALRAWSDYYFRADVEGLDEIPADEPVLLVGNHSGGTLIADTFVFSQHFYDFFRLALELQAPIVPIVAIGGQETALFLGRGRRVSRALGLDRALRLKVFPVQIAPPFGITLLDLPLRVPLPSKITIRVLPRIDLVAELGAGPDPNDAYDLVTERMQDALSDLADERTLPVLG